MIAICGNGSILILFDFIPDSGQSIPFHWAVLLAYCLEIFIIVCACSVNILLVYISSKVRVWHDNTQIMLVFFYLLQLPGQLNRCIFIFYEVTGRLTQGDCNTVIIVGSAVTCTHMNTYVKYGLAFFVERLFANVFVKDYEHTRRRYIPLTIIPATISLGLLEAYVDMTSFVPPQIKLSSIILTIGGTILMQLLLLKYNEKKLSKMNASDSYSLGVKFQLQENIRVLKLCRNILFTYGCIAVVMCSTVLSMVSFDYPPALVSFFEITKSSSALALSVSIILTVKKYRLLAAQILRLRKAGPPKTVPNPSHEGELYFVQLASSWETAFNKGK